jgi:hypothetical protein
VGVTVLLVLVLVYGPGCGPEADGAGSRAERRATRNSAMNERVCGMTSNKAYSVGSAGMAVGLSMTSGMIYLTVMARE